MDSDGEDLNLFFSPEAKARLEENGIKEKEVGQCFLNLGQEDEFATDQRAEHQVDPPTRWFVAPTNNGRCVKIVFLFVDGTIHIKDARDAKPQELARFARHTGAT